jgi:hypothetical protein
VLGLVIISFEGPRFFGQADEDHFFQWLYSLPEYHDVRGVGTTLHLTLATPIQSETVRQLLVIFRRWRISTEPLAALRTRETSRFALWDTDLR